MTVLWVSRASWGAVPAKRPLGGWGAGQPSSKTLHYSGGDVPTDQSTAFYANTVRNIQNFHMNVSSERYSDIAYNFLVAPTGVIFEGRGLGHPSGAQKAGNSSSLAICYLGGPDTPLTDKAKQAISQLFTLVPGPVVGHSYWLPTGCPGPAVNKWLAAGLPASPAPQPTEEEDIMPWAFLQADDGTGDLYVLGPFGGLLYCDTGQLYTDLQNQALTFGQKNVQTRKTPRSVLNVLPKAK